MIKKTFYLLSLLSLLSLLVFAVASYAEQVKQERVIPRFDQISPPYLSTSLLLNPCLDISSLGYTNSDDIIRLVDETKAIYPANTCNNAALVEKLFKARFLQYSIITLVNDPWNLDIEIVKQNRLISQCNDTACLDKALDVIISQLSPLYFNPPASLTGKGFCSSSVDLSSDKKMDLVIKKLVASLSTDNTCGNHGTTADEHYPIYDNKSKPIPHADVNFGVCKASVGNLLIAECQIVGNQVNTQTWIYLLKHDIEPKLLFSSDNGPYYSLDSTCNGMPDLMTNARYNMAEHEIVYYRYNGQQYEAAYSYMDEYIGSDDNGNDMSIAYDISKKEIICKKMN